MAREKEQQGTPEEVAAAVAAWEECERARGRQDAAFSKLSMKQLLSLRKERETELRARGER